MSIKKWFTRWGGAATVVVAAGLAGGMAGCGGGIETVVMPDGKTWTKRNLNVETEDSWCYEDNPSNCAKYGRLYTWEAAVKACAGMGGGWRLPTDEEWSAVEEAVGGNPGTKLKSKTGWTEDYDYIPGTDDYDFSALPGGYRNTNGRFWGAGNYGYWWTATEDGGSSAYGRDVYYYYKAVDRYWNNKSYGLSVRCLRD